VGGWEGGQMPPYLATTATTKKICPGAARGVPLASPGVGVGGGGDPRT